MSETRCSTDGVILYGPPGCGKTMLAKALSNELEFTFISVACTSILNKYQGESEKSVSQIFAEARSCQPCILFIDEMDALCSERNDDNNGSMYKIVVDLVQIYPLSIQVEIQLSTRFWSNLMALRVMKIQSYWLSELQIIWRKSTMLLKDQVVWVAILR